MTNCEGMYVYVIAYRLGELHVDSVFVHDYETVQKFVHITVE